MPYGQSQGDGLLTEVEREQRLKELQREQAETLRDKLGGPLYDWLEDFCDDVGFFIED